MLTLPEIAGLYPVGASTFAIPIHVPQVIGSSTFKPSKKRPAGSALILEEVVFTAFYPADTTSNGDTGSHKYKQMNWTLRPVKESLRGYAYFMEMPYWAIASSLGLLTARTKVPALENAPLLDPARAKTPTSSWPLVIFSHGLGGTRTNYSHLCSQLASQGRVVLAIEHRDGTQPVIMPRSLQLHPDDNAKADPKYIYYIKPEDVVWEGDDKPSPFALRVDQLVFRRLELYLIYRGFTNLIRGPASEEAEKLIFGNVELKESCKNQTDQEFLQSWSSKVDCNQVKLVGHSFGGATLLSILSNAPPNLPGSEVPFDPLPVTHVLALDPWMEPIASPGPAPLAEPARGPDAPKLLVINSEAFTLWDDHFAHLVALLDAWRASIAQETTGGPYRKAEAADARMMLLTVLRAKHVSFSDFGLLVPLGRAARDGKAILDVICRLANAFLEDRLYLELRELPTREMEVVWVKKRNRKETKEGKGKRKLVGHRGEVVVHHAQNPNV